MTAAITHRRVRVNGIDVHLAEAGDGPPVVLLHGFPDIRLINAAVSGYPTTMCQRVLCGVLLRHRPDWVVLSVGGNDVLRYGVGAEKPLVSMAETARNLAEMRRLVVNSGARPVWMTLAGFDVERAASYPPLQARQIWLRDADAVAVSDAIRAQARGGTPSSTCRTPSDGRSTRPCSSLTAYTLLPPASKQSPGRSSGSSTESSKPCHQHSHR